MLFFSGCSLDANLSNLALQDSTPISVQISTANSSLNSLSSFPVDLIFSSDVVDLTESYIQVTGGTLVSGSLTGSGKNYSISITPSGEGVVQISFPEQNITVAGSSDSKKTKSSTVSVSIDTTSATVQLTTAVASPTPLTSIPVTITFNEVVSGLEISDFSITGGGASITSLTGSGSVYQINILPVLDATIYIELPIGAAQDAAGNPSFASNELEIVYQTAPTGALGVSIAGPTPSLGSFATDFVWTVNYTGAWTVNLNTVTLLGTDNAGCSAVISGSGTSQRTITISGCTGNGTVGFSIASGSAHDLDGNPAEAKVSGYATVDNVAPSLSISAPSPSTGNNSTTFVWTVTYTDAAEISLAPEDVILNASATGCLLTVTGSGLSTRQVSVTGCVGYGYVGISIEANSASSAAGYGAPARGPSLNPKLTNLLSASFVEGSSVAIKGSSNSTQNFGIQLASPAVANVTIDYLLTVFTNANNPADFDLVPGSIVIPAGQSSGNISYTYRGSSSVGSRIIQPVITNVMSGTFRGSVNGIQVHRRLIFDNSDPEVSYAKIDSGRGFSCGLKPSGKVMCWGSNMYGQLGQGDTASRDVPTEVDKGITYTDISVADYHVCGLTSDADLKCWGLNGFGAIGDGTWVNKLLPTLIETGIRMVSAGETHTCSISEDFILKCWGSNFLGQFGDGLYNSSSSVPKLITTGSTYKFLSAGRFHTCGITTTNALHCWGANSFYQLGDGTISSRFTPAVIDSGTSYSSVDASTEHTCGITTSGLLRCSGSNSEGQLGDGTFSNKSFFMSIDTEEPYAVLQASGGATCGITSSGVLKCWGYNYYGQLGIGSKIDTNVPTVVDKGVTYSRVELGYSQGCGTTTAGALKCWGNNYYGQLGNGGSGSGSDQSSPVLVDGGVSYSKVSAGNYHSCGITGDGVLKCWGYNNAGQLGDGTYINKLTPVEIDNSTTYVEVDAGYYYTCGVTSTGTVKCWGANEFGLLGNGTTDSVFAPTVVDSGTSYISVRLDYSHTCGITTTGSLRCWESNAEGQLGAGVLLNFPSAISP